MTTLWQTHHAAAVNPRGEVEVDPPATPSNAATTVSDKPTGALRCAALRRGIGADPRLVDVCEGLAVIAVVVVGVGGECDVDGVRSDSVDGEEVETPLLSGAFLSLPIATGDACTACAGEREGCVSRCA